MHMILLCLTLILTLQAQIALNTTNVPTIYVPSVLEFQNLVHFATCTVFQDTHKVVENGKKNERAINDFEV